MASELVGWLQNAGFTASRTAERSVSTVKKLDSLQFPVSVTISDDEQDLVVVMGLRNFADSQKLTVAKLLSLLEANQKTGRASLVFSSERRRIELQTLLANHTDKHSDVRDEINRLAILARDLEAIWNLEESEGGASPSITVPSETQAFRVSDTPPQTSVATTPAPQPAPASVPTVATGTVPARVELTLTSLQGRWAASRSATEAFAMQINGDSTFVLVSVISGKQSRSSGKLTLLNGQLTLEGTDGIRIAGAVTMVSSSELQFSPQATNGTSAALSFRKAQ
jgi:hypothetical protein